MNYLALKIALFIAFVTRNNHLKENT